MSDTDYKSTLAEYRKNLTSKEWFLNKQDDSWKATENFVGHHFSNTIVFVALFLLGGLSYFLFTTGFELQKNGENFGGGLLICMVFLIIAICVYLVSRLRRYLGAVIFHAYITDEITRKTCLEEIDRYEIDLHKTVEGLARQIDFDTKTLQKNIPDDIETAKYISNDLNEYSSELRSTLKGLDTLHSLRKSYYHDNLFDLNITNSVIKHHK